MQLFLLTRDSPSLLSHAVFLSLTLQTTLLFLISGVCLGGDVMLSLGPVYGAVGESVQFNTTIRTADRPVRRVRWEVNEKHGITSISGSVQRGGMLYHHRDGLDHHTGSLELQNLSLSDSGNYTVTIYKTGEDQEIKGTVELLVFERISGVSLTGPAQPLIGDQSSANLTCEGTGSIITTEWMKDGQPLSPSNNIIFSADLRSGLP
ncbi:carcinoembryonic antigen-related cell adhesion molecule 18 [Chanos chanos]|uniref:Carcinoembryonic antigen-related cell adhesion molecule 18 n=1 Tax=Chanos chanos TaxID=29144 RepID=A0A6J2WDL3_CHACN|nr:carcinoembryonic antigen-related cell adhesion molecule 18-like [Chanos chanos]